MIIDGYNLLFAFAERNRITVLEENLESLRESLLRLLSQRLKGKKVRVYFDTSKSFEHTGSFEGIQLRFVHDADRSILTRVKAQDDVSAVVTSDAELRRELRGADVKLISSQKFIAWVESESSPGPAPPEKLKTTTPSEDEVRYWLERFHQAGEEDGG